MVSVAVMGLRLFDIYIASHSSGLNSTFHLGPIVRVCPDLLGGVRVLFIAYGVAIHSIISE